MTGGVSNRVTINAGLRYTLNFPSTEENDQVAVFNLETQQLEYLGRDGQPRAARQLHKVNFGPAWALLAASRTRPSFAPAMRMVWIEMAGITTPFTTPVVSVPADRVAAHARQHRARRYAGQRPQRGSRFRRRRTQAWDRVCSPSIVISAPGYVQQWNASVQRELTSNISVEVAYVGSKITRVGIPDTNLNQLTVDQLAQGASLQARVTNPYFGTIPRSSSLGDPTIPRAQLLKPYPQYTTVSLYRNNVGTTLYHGFTRSSNSGSREGCRIS